MLMNFLCFIRGIMWMIVQLYVCSVGMDGFLYEYCMYFQVVFEIVDVVLVIGLWVVECWFIYQLVVWYQVDDVFDFGIGQVCSQFCIYIGDVVGE